MDKTLAVVTAAVLLLLILFATGYLVTSQTGIFSSTTSDVNQDSRCTYLETKYETASSRDKRQGYEQTAVEEGCSWPDAEPDGPIT